MNEETGLLAGIDLTDEYVQICCSHGKGEPVSVSVSSDPLKYRIPLVLCARYGLSEWAYGDEALQMLESETCVRVTDIFQLAQTGRTIRIFDRSYGAEQIFAKFFSRLFNTIRLKFSNGRITGVVITIKEHSELLERDIKAAIEGLGIPEERIRIITHPESFMYYTVSQNRDIWINDVGLFDFDADSFRFYKLSFGRKLSPMAVVAESGDFSERVNCKMLTDGSREELILEFESIAEQVLGRQVISALYFTGSGFESNWADDILKKLCNGRRIFRGQNLYVKGAAYAAMLLFDGGSGNYLFVGDHALKSSISVRVYKDGVFSEIPLASIGQDCDEAHAEFTVIMDHTNELDFIVRNVLKKDFVCAIMTLDTLVMRDDRSIRLNIKLHFPGRDTCVITAKDDGFGEIYPTNHKIWEQVLKI